MTHSAPTARGGVVPPVAPISSRDESTGDAGRHRQRDRLSLLASEKCACLSGISQRPPRTSHGNTAFGYEAR